MCTVRCCAAGVVVGITFFLASSTGARASGVDTSDPNLPPDRGAYLSTGQAAYSGPGFLIVLQNIAHQPVPPPTRTPSGSNEIEDFNSLMSGQMSLNGGSFVSVNASGPVETEVFNKIGNTTGTFQTEMLALTLTGVSPFGPFMVRESPTLASTGQTTISPIGGGMFHIDSFFDVFTELSLDGGQTWIPNSNGPTRMTLEPEPGSAGLLALAAVVGAIRRRRDER